MNNYRKALQRITDNFCVTCFKKINCKRLIEKGKCDCPFQDDVDLLEEAVGKTEKYDEKATPKKPILRNNSLFDYGTFCPVCNHKFLRMSHYCEDCGQALDWSDINE